MCALLRELIIPVADLDRIAVECGRCGSVTTLSLGLRAPDNSGRQVLPAVASCPVCQRDFDGRLKQALRDLAGLLSYMGGLPEQAISFRVPPPDGDSGRK